MNQTSHELLNDLRLMILENFKKNREMLEIDVK